MRRMLSVWLANWPIDRMRRASPGAAPVEAPFALVLGAGGRLTITAVNAAARRDGIVPGQGLADARAAVPTLIARPAEPARDLAALQRLTLWLGRYGPSFHLEDPFSCCAAASRSGLRSRPARRPMHTAPPDGAAIDITGVAHLFGGEAQLLADLERRLTGLGIAVSAAIADTVGAAHALARHAPARGLAQRIVAPGRTAGSLAPLPVEALRIEPATARLLRRLGLQRIGDLYGLPRPALARRFASRDACEAVLERLDQALGVKAEPRRPMRAPPEFAVRLAFPDPLVTAQGLEAAIAEAAQRLAADLAAACRGGRTIALGLYRSDGTRATAVIGLSRPSRSAAHMLGLLREKLAAFDLGFGIDLIELAARGSEPLAPGQGQLTVLPEAGESSTVLPEAGESRREDGGQTGALDELVDRLANRLGRTRILRIGTGASHLPERSEILLPALDPAPPPNQPPLIPPRRMPSRPPLLLAPPEPIEVVAEVPDGPPARLRWRRKARLVVRIQGPERIAGEWWRPLLVLSPSSATLERTRDYYTVEDEEGARYWVFRAGLYGEGGEAPAWYLHGLYG